MEGHRTILNSHVGHSLGGNKAWNEVYNTL